MVQTTATHAPRRAALPAAAAMLLGAGLACAGNAQATVAEEAVAAPIDVAMPVAKALAEPVATSVATTTTTTTTPIITSTIAEARAQAASVASNIASKAAPSTKSASSAAPITAKPVERSDALALLAAVAAAEPPPPNVARRAPDELAKAIDLAAPEPARVAHARGDMSKWKKVASAKLDEARGGFDVGGLQVGFGIDRAVYVNGALAVATSISIPDVTRITAAQAAQLQQALGGVAAAVSQANGAANSAVAAANAAAADARAQGGQAGAAAQATAAGAVATAQGAAGANASASSGTATGASATATGANGLPTSTVATATGAVTTNGLMNLVQNGPGNSSNSAANVGAMPNMPSTVIQNTLNNQSIQSLMTISASVNTLAAFRSQVANTALNSVIQRMR
ncbi:hypothetical protein [Cupriavidus pampae]|uniref:Flagellin n=1 Tax=Cupriavidus pampae TaxID=659251 RepID=A0ABN7Z7Y0_9BURK|nr:hypothetical protein [Cupriavidus pampae]CAG9182068.1 hypothetical protein LMG32289_05027 [Cupriavidus pampae]